MSEESMKNFLQNVIKKVLSPNCEHILKKMEFDFKKTESIQEELIKREGVVVVDKKRKCQTDSIDAVKKGKCERDSIDAVKKEKCESGSIDSVKRQERWQQLILTRSKWWRVIKFKLT